MRAYMKRPPVPGRNNRVFSLINSAHRYTLQMRHVSKGATPKLKEPTRARKKFCAICRPRAALRRSAVKDAVPKAHRLYRQHKTRYDRRGMLAYNIAAAM